MNDCDNAINLAAGREGYWYSYNSNCEAAITLDGTQVPPAAICGGTAAPFVMKSDGTGSCEARTTGSGFPNVKDNYGYAGIGFNLMPKDQPYDLCAYTGITFTLSGNAVRLKVRTPNVENFNDLGVDVLTPGTHVIPWSMLASDPSWGTAKTWDCSKVSAIQWQALDPTSFDFAIDNVELIIGGDGGGTGGAPGTGGVGTGGTSRRRRYGRRRYGRRRYGRHLDGRRRYGRHLDGRRRYGRHFYRRYGWRADRGRLRCQGHHPAHRRFRR